MSYCRWSSDNFKSDVYTYACVDGTWTTHVASKRLKHDAPEDPLPQIGKLPPDEIAALYKKRGEWFDKAERVDIGLPHDGETFRDAGPGEAAATLKMLRAIGYYVPEYAIDELEEEAANP